MADISDTATASNISVTISGFDANEQRFWQTTELLSVTGSGISVRQLPGCCQVGHKVTVAFRRKTAEYRVESISDLSVELKSIGTHACIFPKDLRGNVQVSVSKESVSIDQPCSEAITEPESVPLPSFQDLEPREKRRHSRVALRAPVKIRKSGSSNVVCSGFFSDVSPGGCYVEAISPLGVSTDVEVEAAAPNFTFIAAGRVVTTHPLVGMGIAFSEDHPEIAKLAQTSSTPQGAAIPAVVDHDHEERRSSRMAPQLFSELMTWFANNSNLDRDKFFEIVHLLGRKKDF